MTSSLDKPAPITIPPEYLQEPYLSQEARDKYNAMIGRQRLHFDFTEIQTPERVQQLWKLLDKQTKQQEMHAKQQERRVKESDKLQELRYKHELMLHQHQVKMTELKKAMKCSETPPEQKQRIAKQLKLMHGQQQEIKQQLMMILEQLVKYADEEEAKQKMIQQHQQEAQATCLKPDTRMAGDEELPTGFVLQPPPLGKRLKRSMATHPPLEERFIEPALMLPQPLAESTPDVCPLPFDTPS
ncbi:golgin subfamily A member 6-like protein 26 [Heptranchias perlo]|uniref:golgin subfamily A member 6-like protein 26 n=1 Tax=Heptranchias perlo TaxID=212740 RepID=UPI00355A3904